MARQIIHKLVDDIDGGEANETVTFALDGRNYTIDLCEKNAGVLREVFAPYVAAGTRAGRGTGSWRGASAQRSGRADNKAVRKWAAANGYELSDRGRIPLDVVDAFESARKRPAAAAGKPARQPGEAVSEPDKVAKRTPRKKAAAAA